jgi:hypothetical protein
VSVEEGRVRVVWDKPFVEAFYSINVGSIEYIFGQVNHGSVFTAITILSARDLIE